MQYNFYYASHLYVSGSEALGSFIGLGTVSITTPG
jgi:hypothetical protein